MAINGKIILGGISLNVKSIDIQTMADTDPNAFLKHMKQLESNVLGPGEILFPSEPSKSYTTGWAMGLASADGPSEVGKFFRDFKSQHDKCGNCEDRPIWRLGLFVKMTGRICTTCAATCLSRGITVRHEIGGRVRLCRAIKQPVA